MRSRLSQRVVRWSTRAVGLFLVGSFVAASAAAKQPAQAGTLAGRVTDARSAEGVAGATIEVEGTRIGASTADDGRYRVTNVPAGTHSIVARRLGFAAVRRSVTVAAGQELTTDFAMEQTAISLDQVVIAGVAGTAELRSVGNAISAVDASDALAKSSAPDIGTLLNARVSGVVITQPTGRLGAGPAIQIRGRSSIGLGNAPLIYIDGVRVNNATGTGPTSIAGGNANQYASVAGRLNDIMPEDIERIEVIKGPAASTIYGTEASNGVIQIITKRGMAGAKPQIALQTQQGPIWFRDAEGRFPTNFVKDSSGNIVPWNAIQQERERGDPLFETGWTGLYNGSMSGARDQLRYFLSAGYENDQGIEPNNSLRQFSVHANVDLAPSSTLDLATSINYVNLRNHLGVDNGASAMFGGLYGHALAFPRGRGFASNFVPEVTQVLWDNSQNVNRFTGSERINHAPLTWFQQRLTIGMDYSGDDSRVLERLAPPELAPLLTAAGAAGRIGQVLRNSNNITADYSGTATINLTPVLSSGSSVGGQLFRSESNTSALGGLGFPAPGIETVSGTAQQVTATQTQSLNTTIGAYAQQKFGWRDRLFLTGALRVDNNSAFGEDFKWVTYPKVDASWVVSEEPFWRWTEVVNQLRLRAAYGESGRQPATFSALRTFSPVQGPNATNAVTPNTIGNSDLKPERGKEFEAGFEVAVLDRLNVDLTYFNKKTEDLIVNQSVAPSSGFAGSRPVNLGRVDNHGVELVATAYMLRRANLDWELRYSVATNRDEIKDLGGLPSVITTTGQFHKVGYPIGGIFSKVVVSADRAPDGTATNVLCDGGPGQAPVACAQAPLLFVGTPTPKMSGSVANTFTIGRNLRLYALVDFKRGNKQLNADEVIRCTGLLGVRLCDANYHPEKYAPVYLAETVGNALNQSIVDQFWQDASFTKLREISATYTLPNGWVPGTSQASVSLAARELHIWTNYRGIDPEVNQAGSGGLTAQSQAILPSLSRFIATFNVRF